MKLIIGMLMGLLASGACIISPCPKVFQYTKNLTTNEFVGVITLADLPKNTILELRVNITLDSALPTRYLGELLLAHSVDQTMNQIRHGDPIKFILLFPTQSTLPSIAEIKVNGVQYCYNYNREIGRNVHNIFYRHSLYPPKFAAEDDGTLALDYTRCGTIGNRINKPISKWDVNFPGGWPWHVAIYKMTDDGMSFICSGTLITNKHVLIAASCIPRPGSPRYKLEVVMGVKRLDYLSSSEITHRTIPENGFKIHPEFDWKPDAQADIAILEMNQKVDLGPKIRTLCIPDASRGYENIVGHSGNVVGWGRDEGGNQQIVKPVMDSPYIQSQSKCSTTGTFNDIYPYFCAHHTDGVCNADLGSGFALYDNEAGAYFLRGIATSIELNAFGTCTFPNYVSYIDVKPYSAWIHATIYTSN